MHTGVHTHAYTHTQCIDKYCNTVHADDIELRVMIEDTKDVAVDTTTNIGIHNEGYITDEDQDNDISLSIIPNRNRNKNSKICLQ